MWSQWMGFLDILVRNTRHHSLSVSNWCKHKFICNCCRFCTTGLPSDVVVEVGEMSFHLHKVTFHDYSILAVSSPIWLVISNWMLGFICLEIYLLKNKQTEARKNIQTHFSLSFAIWKFIGHILYCFTWVHEPEFFLHVNGSWIFFSICPFPMKVLTAPIHMPILKKKDCTFVLGLVLCIWTLLHFRLLPFLLKGVQVLKKVFRFMHNYLFIYETWSLMLLLLVGTKLSNFSLVEILYCI